MATELLRTRLNGGLRILHRKRRRAILAPDTMTQQAGGCFRADTKGLGDVASALFENALRELQGKGPSGRLAQLVIAIYLAASIASFIWALSAGPIIDNPLGALIQWRVGDRGTGLVTIANHSENDWQDVKVFIDERYYLLVGRVPAQQHISAALDQFLDGNIFLRPDQMFPYEGAATRPAREHETQLSLEHRPRSIRLSTDLGDVITHPRER